MKLHWVDWTERLWYGPRYRAWPLLPLSVLFTQLARARRWAYQRAGLARARLPVPVIVVGNLSVGGTGKTPLLIALAHTLRDQGYQPGLISRGYGGRAAGVIAVTPTSDPALVGDEPVLLARRTACPVAVARRRVAAARHLLDAYGCDVILSDDGLQHYALPRDIEIAVVDGVRRFGNGWCLPAGPLREPPARLRHVDFVVCNGGLARDGEWPMHVRGTEAICLVDGQNKPLAAFRDTECHALAGIGAPARFFAMLKAQDLALIQHVFPDHHAYCAAEIVFDDNKPVLMTEKDAVKCESFADARHWYVPVQAELPAAFTARLLHVLREKRHG